MLPLQARVDLGVMAIKKYSAFPKAQHYWNLTIRLFSVISRTLIGGVILFSLQYVTHRFKTIFIKNMSNIKKLPIQHRNGH